MKAMNIPWKIKPSIFGFIDFLAMTRLPYFFKKYIYNFSTLLTKNNLTISSYDLTLFPDNFCIHTNKSP